MRAYESDECQLMFKIELYHQSIWITFNIKNNPTAF